MPHGSRAAGASEQDDRETYCRSKSYEASNAISEVVPEFDNDPVAEAYLMADGLGDSLIVYPAKRGEEIVGYALNTFSNNGFGGNIQIMVGFDMDNKIVNYSVLQHAETPGLGSKMSDWFKDITKPSQSILAVICHRDCWP